MDDIMERGHLRLVTESEARVSTDRERADTPAASMSGPPQLRLIRPDGHEVATHSDDKTARTHGTQLSLFPDVIASRPALLGFYNMYRAWGDSFAGMIEQIQPIWIFDLRPSPSFNLIRLDRRRAYSLFRRYETTYCNLNVMLGLWDRQDPRIASGEIAEELNRFAARPDQLAMRGPIVFLVDEEDVIPVGIDVFPRTLRPRPRGGWKVHRFDNRAPRHV